MGFLRTDTGRIRLVWRVLLFIVLFSAFSALISLIPLPGIPGQTLPVLAGALVAGWFLLAMEGRSPEALGFYLAPEAVSESLLGLSLGVVVASAAVVGMVLLGTVSWVVEAGTGAGYWRSALAALWVFAVPAAAEEALLRGYLLQALAEGWGSVRALVVTSVVFGALHLGNPNVGALALANIALAGLFLGAIYLKTASLWWASGAHLGWNWAHGFLADLPVSGLDVVDAPGLRARVTGLSWMSGGEFGPEGSVAATVVLGAATLLIWNASWLRPGRRAREVRPLILAGEDIHSPRNLHGEFGGIADHGREP